MKNLFKYTGAVLVAASFLTACTGSFEDMNTNPKGVSDEELKQDGNFVGSHYVPMMQSIYYNASGGNWEYQLTQNLNADMYSNYMATATGFAGGVNNTTYALNNGWNDYCWNYTYNYVMAESKKAYDKYKDDIDSYLSYDAINIICRVLAMSRLVDQYGPVIYSHYGEAATGGQYDSAEDAYKTFFSELSTAANELSRALNGEGAAFRSDFDGSNYGGDMAKWARLCNTLRLRLALRVANYDSAWAKTEAEAAAKDANGLIDSNDANFAITGHSFKNPLYEIANSWSDCLINANLVSILGGMGDARLSKYAQTNNSGQYFGIRLGVPLNQDLHDIYTAGVVSHIYQKNNQEPAILATAAETYLLLAEAALRGWNVGGSAEDFYKQGVQASFEQWGAGSADAYLASHAQPAGYVDPINPDWNAPAVSTVTPCWEDATTDEERFERIATQRWIAIFPEGMNGWADLRRTHYPKVITIFENDSQGSIPTEVHPGEPGIRRLTYTIDENNNNPSGIADAVSKLKGADTGATRIFWDVDKSNF